MIELSEQQQCVFDKYLLRENIFISEVLYILNFAFYYIYLHSQILSQ